jgi:type IV pilus biogenesis protein CpaD/CtpE
MAIKIKKMKLYINIVLYSVFSSVLASCSSSDNESTPVPVHIRNMEPVLKNANREDA